MLSTVWLPRGRCQAAIQVVQFCFVICHPISGGYCGGVPPLPIPNREVKPACADGTAMQCGRVGGRLFHYKQRVPVRVKTFRDFCLIIIAYRNDWTSGLLSSVLPPSVFCPSAFRLLSFRLPSSVLPPSVFCPSGLPSSVLPPSVFCLLAFFYFLMNFNDVGIDTHLRLRAIFSVLPLS